MSGTLHKHKRVLTIAAILASLIVLGALFAKEGKVFSHKEHIENGAECASCHDVSREKELPRLNKEACGECHEGDVPEPTLAAKAKRSLPKFPHKLHSDSLECNDCHKKVVEETLKSGEPMLEKEDCIKCHKENSISTPENDCSKCHGVDMRRTPPEDHKSLWLKNHGREADWRVSGDHGRDCALCHRQDACQTCHKVRKPQDHTGLWRVRMHGTAASWDSARCKTCHETGVCIRCHHETKPLNHTGNWKSLHGLTAGSKTSENCAACHSPSWCAACHKGGAK
ncbi:MAG: hypothetical protein Kow0090_06740 [Myxococcota bacterium]